MKLGIQHTASNGKQKCFDDVISIVLYKKIGLILLDGKIARFNAARRQISVAFASHY